MWRSLLPGVQCIPPMCVPDMVILTLLVNTRALLCPSPYCNLVYKCWYWALVAYAMLLEKLLSVTKQVFLGMDLHLLVCYHVLTHVDNMHYICIHIGPRYEHACVVVCCVFPPNIFYFFLVHRTLLRVPQK